MTQKELAAFHDVNASTITRLKQEGIDVFNADAVRERLQGSQRPAPSVKKVVASVVPSLDEVTNIEEAKLLKEVTLIEKEQLKLAVEQGKFLDVTELVEALQKIGAVVKAAFLRLSNDLPQILEGKTAKQIKKIMKTKTDLILKEMESEFAGLVEGESDESD